MFRPISLDPVPWQPVRICRFPVARPFPRGALFPRAVLWPPMPSGIEPLSARLLLVLYYLALLEFFKNVGD